MYDNSGNQTMKKKLTMQSIMSVDKPELKWPSLPTELKIIQDTREQLPLFTQSEQVIIRALHNGDYSIDGYEHLFAIERKGIGDLYSYIGLERTTKTNAKMERFKEIIAAGGWVGLIIEASEDDTRFNPYSQLNCNHIYYSLCSFEVKTGIHVYYNRNRDELRRYVISRAISFWEKMHED